ncbi:MAG: HTH-type transcriptional activator RhaR [Gammaproteobacteria bacterium]|nr:HTH-type transcriptional activator RhaR [Gammaproteobacteria bacterium]
MAPAEEPINVAILAFPEATASTVYGMYDLFKSAGRDWGYIVEGRAGRERMRPLVAASGMEPFAAANGVRMQPDCTLAHCPAPDVVCVPEILLPPGEPLAGRFGPETEWLRRSYADGATITTACSGAMLLAEAGLLDGHEATTHWAYCDTMKRRYPQIRVVGQRALVASGAGQRLIMAGGGTSWLDVALFVVARFVGVEEAMQLARLSLIDWHDIGQQPFASLAYGRQNEDALIARCQVWIAEHYARPSPVAGMTGFSGLPERSFKRRFQHATGMSPLDYVHTLRIEESKHMLESTDMAVEAIAQEIGYEDAGFFGRLFRRKVGLTPAQYRRRFGAMRRALSAAERAWERGEG